MPLPIGRLSGMNDLSPEECVTFRQTTSTLEECFASFGYRPIDTPILEDAELFLLKSGEEVISKLFAFSMGHRTVCLRPEMTASVARYYLEHLQGTLEPIRVYYVGTVFRHERTKRGRYRQFTQAGVELVGAGGSMADAEVIALACRGLEALHIKKYRLEIGHLGVIDQLLEHLGLEEASRSLVMSSTEELARGGLEREQVFQRLDELYPWPKEPSDESTEPHLAELVEALGEAKTQSLFKALIRELGLSPDGQTLRDSQDVVQGIIRKSRSLAQKAKVLDALKVIEELQQARGKPSQALAEIRLVLKRYGLSNAPLEQLEETLELLSAYNIPQERLSINAGLGRGVQYYTGLVFEVHYPPLGPESQMCGGGSYDELLGLLGATSSTPARGFGYGVERLALAREEQLSSDTSRALTPHILVVPVNLQDRGYAIAIAQRLRREGLKVELDVKVKGVKANLKYADKASIPFVALAGTRERERSQLLLHNMATRQEEQIALTGLGQLRQIIPRKVKERKVQA